MKEKRTGAGTTFSPVKRQAKRRKALAAVPPGKEELLPEEAWGLTDPEMRMEIRLGRRSSER